MKEKIKISLIEENTGQVEGLKKNPRTIDAKKLKLLTNSLKETPELLEHRGLLVFPVGDKFVAIGGNQRLLAAKKAKFKEVWCEVLPEDTPVAKLNEYLIKDNSSFGEWDMELLNEEWNEVELVEWGLEPFDTEDAPKEKKALGSLQDKFIVPPFSILDTRRGYWVNRKRLWRNIIGDNGESRQFTLAECELMKGINNGVSLLDPVLAEIVCKWFGIPGGSAFDCFAGDTVFGFVAAHSGITFTGVELREEQAAINNARVEGMSAKYICDDGQNVLNHIEKDSQDLLFSCPRISIWRFTVIKKTMQATRRIIETLLL